MICKFVYRSIKENGYEWKRILSKKSIFQLKNKRFELPYSSAVQFWEIKLFSWHITLEGLQWIQCQILKRNSILENFDAISISSTSSSSNELLNDRRFNDDLGSISGTIRSFLKQNLLRINLKIYSEILEEQLNA